MPQYIISDFRRGVDTRRSAWASAAGTLSVGRDVHISPGGDIETRKDFVHLVNLPGTFGLAALAGRLQVFGSALSAPSNLPSNFDYTQLVHPAAAAMTRILDVEPFDGENYVIAQYGDDVRHFYDGARVRDWDTDVCRYRFKVTGGTSSAGTNKVSSITANGVEILNAAVDWTTSNSHTAALLVASINTKGVYSAYAPVDSLADYAEVVLVSPTTAAAGHAIVITVGGNVTTAAISAGAVMEPATLPGLSVRTAGEKLYVTSGANLVFSGVLSPTNFSTNATGGGFINISTHSAGAEELIGTELFYEDLLVFAKDASQLWHVEADDTNNDRKQTFQGLGMIGSRAALSHIEGQAYFLDRTGLRAVQTKDSSGRSSARSVSKQIDRELVAYISGLAPTVAARAILVTEPEEDRVWVIIGERIYVRSWFPDDGVSAWTHYEPGFTISDVAVAEGRLYVRSGDDIYIYGGTAGGEYFGGECEVRLPMANFRAPATLKGLFGIDVGCTSEWSVYLSTNLDDLDAATREAIISGPTFSEPNIPVASQASHVSLKLVHNKAERGTIDSIVFHYKTDAAA
jgi:hypothetical protein